jgi:hypothetical protein
MRAGRRALVSDLWNAAAYVPMLRPVGGAVLAFAVRAAEELGENDGSVPDAVVERALTLVEPDDCAQIIRCFAEAEPETWRRCRRLINQAERELIASAIRGAICDRRPVPRTQLLVIEHSRWLPPSAAVRLGVVLPSGAIWSIADADAVLAELPPDFLWQEVQEPRDGPLLDRVDDRHVARVRLLCDALERHLPIPSLPRASRIVLADSRNVLANDSTARRTAAALLLSHTGWIASMRSPVVSVN